MDADEPELVGGLAPCLDKVDDVDGGIGKESKSNEESNGPACSSEVASGVV